MNEKCAEKLRLSGAAMKRWVPPCGGNFFCCSGVKVGKING